MGREDSVEFTHTPVDLLNVPLPLLLHPAALGPSIARPSLAMEAELSEKQKWELSPVEQLKVAVYRRELGNAEMRQGHAQEVQQPWYSNVFQSPRKTMQEDSKINLDLLYINSAKTREGML